MTTDHPATEDKTSVAEAANAADSKPEGHHQSNSPVEAPEDANPKTVASPARPSSHTQEQGDTDKPSARRERKQTAFFQPEKQAETAKLEIKEVQLSSSADH